MVKISPARFDQHALAGGRERKAGHAAGDVVPVRHHPGKIAGGADGDDVFFAGFRIEFVDIARLLEHHRTGRGVQAFHVEIGELGDLRQLL